MNDLNVVAVATYLVLGYALVGAVLVVLSAAGVVEDAELRLSFKSYLEQMVIAAGGLAIGRGLNASTKDP